MKRMICSAAAVAVTLLASCEEERGGNYEIEVTETRQLTSLDRPRKMHATAAQRFFDLKPFPFEADHPDYWREVAPGQLVQGAYRIYGARLTVSVARGGIGMNVNRWMGQFGRERLSAEDLRALPRINLAGREAVLVETKGTFQGRRGPARPGQALLGAIAPVGDQLLVLKMVGPEEVVEAEKENFQRFADTFSMRSETTGGEAS